MRQSFEEYLSMSQTSISISGFILNLILAAVVALVLAKIYVKYGNSLSNRRQFAKNFMLITITTVLIITVVKSSLALSLGLVGALSVIRFRSAIKEPEELSYLFLSIALGLGFGANQTSITVIAFIGICTLIILNKNYAGATSDDHSMFLTIKGEKLNQIDVTAIITILSKYCDYVDLRRMDENAKYIEATFSVLLAEYDHISKIQEEVKLMNEGMNLTFLDNEGI